MSGICGLFNPDQAPVAQGDLRAMTAMLETRGPERTGRWCDGPVGFGHTLLATTPEQEFERQPFAHAETGCVIAADVRLDNRDELLGALGSSDRHDSIGDAELILMAFLAWGEQSLDRLLGDFAFAIWDPRHQSLFCARDHFGMRPLYYHHEPGRRFLFASDARAILVLPQVPYRINQGRIADFLVQELEWIDYTSTFFEDVCRLPPGHKATVTAAGAKISEYWKPVPGPELGLMSDEDYAQGFLEVFSRAVAARLRVPSGTVGSMLSGGMDSGSVVAVAKEILRARGDQQLRTYSGVRQMQSSIPDNSDCAETRAIYAAASMPSISPTFVHPDASQVDIETMISRNEEPFDGEMIMIKSIYRAAHADGIRVVLDGAGGDVVLGEGSYIVRLIRQGKLISAMGEIAGQNRFWGGGSVTADLVRYARSAIIPEAAKKKLRRFLDFRRDEKYLADSIISRDFASSVRIDERLEQLRQMFNSDRTSDYAVECSNIIRPNMTGGRERYARSAAAAGMEACDPFLDKRVVDYCTRLPGRVRMKNGWPKMLLREVMSDKLPDEVLWCRAKPHLGWLFNASVTEQGFARGELNIDTLQERLRDYVDSTALAIAWHKFRENGDAERIHSAYLLSVWLREAAQRPVVPD